MKKRHRKPSHIDTARTQELRAMVSQLADKAPDNVTIYCVGHDRGFAKCLRRQITVPLWTFKRGEGYALYYLAHELAHIADFDERRRVDHGPNFYRHFKRLCPAHLQHHELGYKPRNAAAAGIQKAA